MSGDRIGKHFPDQEHREIPLNNGVPIVREKLAPIERSLLEPHYNDPRFRDRYGSEKAGESVNITVYLDPELDKKQIQIAQESTSNFGLRYEYSDRLAQEHDAGRRNQAWKHAGSLGLPADSAATFEAYLRALTEDNSIEIKHIVSYVNQEGWGQKIYGYSRR